MQNIIKKGAKLKFTIKRFHKLGSTNTAAQEYAEKGAKEGLVIVADYQTEGRGRLGRKWVSLPGQDLLFSILLRPPLSPSKAPLLTQIICRSVASVLREDYKLQPTFKRPNDILIEGKKICGVLLESQSNGNPNVDHVIIGIGLNVNSELSTQLPAAISLKELKGKELAKGPLLKKVLKQIQTDLTEVYASRA